MSSFSKCLMTVLFSAIAFAGMAQRKSPAYEAGINLGTLVYQGDLTPKIYGYTKSLKPAFGVNASKSLNNYFSLRGSLLFGKISADESQYDEPVWRQYRNLKFNSPVTELSSTLVFHPLSNNTDEFSSRLSPYVFAGVAVSILNVKRDWSGFNSAFFDSKSDAAIGLEPDTLNSIPDIIPMLPIGAGVRYILSPRLALNAEGNYRLTAADYIDGFKYSGK